jgi:hypothetical protein
VPNDHVFTTGSRVNTDLSRTASLQGHNRDNGSSEGYPPGFSNVSHRPHQARRKALQLLHPLSQSIIGGCEPTPRFSTGHSHTPSKKDKNAEKPRIRTLSAAKGRAPGIVSNDDDPLIPDGSFFPLNLDPLRDGAGASDSERGASSLSILIYLKRTRDTGASTSYRPV